jgi:hypothetical protein
MAERKVRTLHEGKEVEGIDVQVRESSEKWSEFTLEDGTILRMKLSLMSAVRIPGQYDPQGNPLYNTAVNPQILVVESDDKLRKKD